MAEINDLCLFCLSKIAPFPVSPRKTDKPDPPTFNKLCEFLDIKFTDEDLKQIKCVPVFLNGNTKSGSSCGSCEQFLCFDCFVMGNNLRDLYEEMRKLQETIASSAREMRRRITEQINSSVVAALKKEGAAGRRGRRKKNAITVEFVEVFQRLVKESDRDHLPFTSLSTAPISNKKKCISEPVKESKSRKKKAEDQALASGVAKRRKEESGEGIDPKIKQEDEPVPVDSIPLEANVKIEDFVNNYQDGADESNDFDTNFDSFTEEEEHNDDVAVAVNSGEFIKENSESTQPEPSDEDSQKIMIPIPEISKKKPVMKKPQKRASTLNNPCKKRRTGKVPQTVRDFTCTQCSLTFPTISKYRTHINSHGRLTTKSLNITTTYTENGKKLYSCSMCENPTKYSLTRFRQHMLSHEAPCPTDSSTPLHSCDQCDSQFVLQLNLDLHKLCTHRFKHLHLKCEQCGDSNSPNREALMAHLKTHDSATSIHSCKSCPMVSSTLNNLLSHIMIKHSASKKLICPECDAFTAATGKELIKHCKQTHSDKLSDSLNCHLCDKQYLFSIKLRHHLRTVHEIVGEEGAEGWVEKPREKLFCTKCANGKEYKTKVSFDNHMLLMHSDVPKPFQCDQCDRSYMYKSHLQQHVDEKHVRHQCPHCPNSYKGQVQLEFHLKTHTGQGLFPCEVCGKQFPRKAQLKIHSVTHLDKSKGGGCVCEVCGKEFVHEIRLRTHMNLHKEKKLKCKHCNMLFARRDNLKSHLRTHTGERPFGCPVCTKGFNRRDILLVHMSTHGYGLEEARQVYKEYLETIKVDGS